MRSAELFAPALVRFIDLFLSCCGQQIGLDFPCGSLPADRVWPRIVRRAIGSRLAATSVRIPSDNGPIRGPTERRTEFDRHVRFVGGILEMANAPRLAFVALKG